MKTVRKILAFLSRKEWHGWAGGIGIGFFALAILFFLSFQLVPFIICMVASAGWIRADLRDKTGLVRKMGIKY